MLKSLKQLLQSIIVAVLFVAGISYMQAAWVGPTANPPSNNQYPVINLSTEFQDKIGNIQATQIEAQNTVCIGTDCRTSWPSAGGGTASCRMEKRIVRATGFRFFWDPGTHATIYPTCDIYLTPEARAAGWTATGGDNCTTMISNDCGASVPSVCVYTRVYCPSGITVATPTNSLSTYQGTPHTIPLNSPAL